MVFKSWRTLDLWHNLSYLNTYEFNFQLCYSNFGSSDDPLKFNVWWIWLNLLFFDPLPSQCQIRLFHVVFMQGILKNNHISAKPLSMPPTSTCWLREWPRSQATFNWPIKSISFPRFAVHRTWTRSQFSFKIVLLSTTIQLNISVTLIWTIRLNMFNT